MYNNNEMSFSFIHIADIHLGRPFSDLSDFGDEMDICINATLSYIYTLIIATLYCNIRAAKHIPTYDKDFVIILGFNFFESSITVPLVFEPLFQPKVILYEAFI